jgi:hypothetical protein
MHDLSLLGAPMSTPISTSASTKILNVRVPLALYEDLERLAQSTARSKSFVTLEALASYLKAQSWQVKEIEAGLTEADRGDFASDAEVKAVWEKYSA